MIVRNKESKSIEMLKGLTRKTLAQSQTMMICEFTFLANVRIPIHTHIHDQVGYVVNGRVVMHIDGQEFELSSGDSYSAPSTVPHGALTLEPTIIIDTFSPPREDYR